MAPGRLPDEHHEFSATSEEVPKQSLTQMQAKNNGSSTSSSTESCFCTSKCRTTMVTEGASKRFSKWHAMFSNRLRDKWGWIVTLSTFILFLFTYGFIGCFGLLFVSLQEEFHRGAMETGWVGCLAMAVAHFGGPLTNYLVHKLQSPRRVVFMGVVCCFGGLVLSSIVPSIYYLFGTLGFGYGLGLNMVTQAALVLIVQYFPDKNSARSVSAACTGLTIGMLVLSPVVSYALEAIGWRATLRWFGVTILLIGSFCSLPMLPVGHKTKNMQRHLAETKFSKVEDDLCLSKSTQELGKTNVQEEKSGLEEQRNLREDDSVAVTKPQRSVLRRGKLWLLCSCMFFTAIAQTFYAVNYVSHLKEQGISAKQGAIMITLYASGQIAIEILLSIIADKLPFHKIYIIAIACFLGGIATIPIMFSSSAFILKAISTVLGFLRAPRTVLVIPVTIEMFGVHHVQETTAMVMVAHGLGFIIGACVMGLTFDKTGSYTLSITLCIALTILAAFLYMTIPLWNKYKRWKRSRYPTGQEEPEDDDMEEDCHLAPMSNMVARVREIVPILVESQESLATTNGDHHPYQRIVPNACFEHPRGETDCQLSNRSKTANDLIIQLSDNNDIIIHLPQLCCSNEITGAIPCIQEVCDERNNESVHSATDVCESDGLPDASQAESLIQRGENSDQCVSNVISEHPEITIENPTCCLTENPLLSKHHCIDRKKCGQIAESSDDNLNKNVINHINLAPTNTEMSELMVVFDNEREVKSIVGDMPKL